MFRVSWIKTQFRIGAVDGIVTVLTGSFAVVLQLQTKQKEDDQCSVTIHLGSHQDERLDEQLISLNIGIPLFQSCQLNSKPSEIHLPLLICPDVRGLLLLSSREIHVDTWLAIPWVIISQRKWIRSGAAALCPYLCDIICHGTRQWRTSQWASSILTAFHTLMSSTIKKHWGATENRKLSSTPEKPDGSSHQCRKDSDKAAPTWMSSSRPTQNIKWWERAHDMRNEFEWHTHRLEMSLWFFCLRCGRSGSLSSTSILDVTQTRSYFAEPCLTYGDPEYVSRVSLVIHCLQLGYRMIQPGCSTVRWTPINRLQHPFQCQWFWLIKTGQGCNSLLLCRPDIAV